MKVKKITIFEVVFIVSMIIFVMFWSFMGKDGPIAKSNLSNVGKDHVVTVGNDSVSDSVWKKGNVYVIKKKNLQVKNKLTIEPGVVIKFEPDSIKHDSSVLSKN